MTKEFKIVALDSHCRRVYNDSGGKNMGIILEVKELSKSFSAGGVQQHVLTNLNMSIAQGEFVVVMGSSGSGKSTLLYALSGMEKASLGEIKYGDYIISNYTTDQLAMFRRLNCGFVFQDCFLHDNMSVMDNVLVGVFAKRKDKKKYIEKTKQLLIKVGISDNQWHKFPTQLSGGERQRVAMVRAMINDPKILFADEPTGALNSSSAEDILDLMNAYNADGGSVILVTHDIKTAIRGSRVIYIKDGVIHTELDLGDYQKENEISRMSKITSFLDKTGW